MVPCQIALFLIEMARGLEQFITELEQRVFYASDFCYFRGGGGCFDDEWFSGYGYDFASGAIILVSLRQHVKPAASCSSFFYS